jgi:hypothetical protein
MTGKDKLIVSVYVDDLIVTNTRAEDIDGFKGEMVLGSIGATSAGSPTTSASR